MREFFGVRRCVRLEFLAPPVAGVWLPVDAGAELFAGAPVPMFLRECPARVTDPPVFCAVLRAEPARPRYTRPADLPACAPLAARAALRADRSVFLATRRPAW